MLRVSLLGNLGADPEQRFTQKGTAMSTFRVAVNQVQTGQDGERIEKTEWFRIRTLGRLADSAMRLTKGSRVFVAGRLDIQHFQSRDGEPRTGFDVWADEVVNVSGRPSGMDNADGGDEVMAAGNAEPTAGGAAAARPRAAVAAVPDASSRNGGQRTATADPDLDDLPF